MSAGAALPAGRLAAYAGFSLPLSMAALPLYVQVPKFYAETTGLGLATIGAVLLLVRCLDAVQDPWLGGLSDRYRTRTGKRLGLLAWSAPLLAAGMVALFAVPPGVPAAGWLAATLIATYFAYSLASIAYQAHGADMSRDYHERTRVSAWREGSGLLGVMAAAVLPDLLGGGRGSAAGFARFAWLFAVLVVAAAWIAVRWAPSAPRPPEPAGHGVTSLRASLWVAARNVRFRHLLIVFALNGIASAVPATLVLFYIQDVLGSHSSPGIYLAAYFASAAIGMPLWVATARRFGKTGAWLIAMLLAIAAFAWAWSLGEGSQTAFMCICVITGIALGADLALPPSLLADAIDEPDKAREGGGSGAYFGVWTLATKLNLGIAAGTALPLVGLLGYVPGTTGGTPARALAAVYALLPCFLKLFAVAALWRWRGELDAGRPASITGDSAS